MEDVTIAIKTFERPRCLKRLLESISKAGWCGPGLVADDSRDQPRDRVLSTPGGLVTDYLWMPFNSGSA